MYVAPLTEYTPAIAARVRALLIQLSRSGTDKGEIPAAWFQRIIASPTHDLLLAYNPEGEIIGMATVSLVMGAGIGQNAYLEDFVTDASVRGQGVGSLLWEAICAWGREHGATRLEFTCGRGRESAQAFYAARGAERYDTNFYRVEL